VTSNADTVIAARRARAVKNDEYLARRAALIAQAADLFHTRGLNETSLADIAAAAGLDRASIYYYFKNKEEVVAEVLREVLDASLAEHSRIARGDLPPDEKLRQMIVMSMELFDRHYPHLFVYVRADLERSLISRKLRAFFQRYALKATALWRDVIEEGVHAGVFQINLPVDVATSVVLGAITSAHWWYAPGGETPPSALGDGIATLLTEGLRVS